MSEATAAHSYSFEQLAPSPSKPPDGAQIVAEASAEAEGIREQARSEGYAAGHAAGREQGLAELAGAARALGEALNGLRTMRATLSDALERDAVEFALELAEKILSGALEVRPEMVVEVVQGALRRIGDRRMITVLVNPADLEPVRTALGEPRERDGAESCEVLGDAQVPPGGAIAQASEGEIDASVRTQLERAREVALAALGAGEPVA